MKKTPQAILLTIILIISNCFNLYAQTKEHDHDHEGHNHDLCLTSYTEEDEEELNENYELMKKYNLRLSTEREMVLIPVTYHISRRTDGTGGLSVQEVEEAMTRVNGIYEQFGMSFYQCGPIQFHNNNALFTYDREGESDQVIEGLDIENTYNMYFCNNVNGACGFAFFPGRSADRTVLSNGCITNGTTLEHEIGHSFGLRHTHQGGNENVARPGEGNSNCTTAGDRLCDTEADPTLSGMTQNNTSCELSNLGNGPDGLPYRTDGANIMSYAPRKTCRTVFSQEQMDLMYFTAANNSDRTKFTCSSEPVANFGAVNSKVICVGHETQLEDLSFGDQPSSWNWSFDGGVSLNNTSENPTVTYASTGSYPVSLTVTNDRGSNTITEQNYLKVINPFSIPYEEDFSEGGSVLNDFDVVTNPESRIAVNTGAGRTDNGLQLTGMNADVYYVKAKEERAFHNNPHYNSSVTIPCLDATDFENLELTFDLRLLYSTNPTYTTFRLFINGNQIEETYNISSNNEEEWVTITKDVSEYAGGMVYITFQANTRTSNSNSVYIDNISLTGEGNDNLQPIISSNDAVLFCEGGSSLLQVSLEEEGNLSYQWRESGQDIQGANSETYLVTSSGNYSVYVTNGDREGTSQNQLIEVINKPNSPIISVSPSCGEGIVLLETQAERLEVNWYTSPSSDDKIYTGLIYEPNLSQSTNFYVESVTKGITGNVGLESNTLGTGGIHAGGQNLVFDAYKDIILKSATVYAEETKNRTLEVRNALGELVTRKEVFIEAGESVITIDITIPAGNDYRIGFTEGADLYRDNGSVNFPYTLEGLVSIKQSLATSDPFGFYYYLYNWEVEEVYPACVGDRTEVLAKVNTKPEAPVTFDIITCDNSNTPLILEASANGNGELRWYVSENATEIISTGDSLIVEEQIVSNEDYYVEEVSVVKEIDFGGPINNAFGGGGIHAGGNYLIFDTYKEVLLKSALIYAEVAKNRTLELRTENDELIESKEVFIPAGESRIALDLMIPVASNLRIGFSRGADLYRNNDEVSFPFNIGNAVTITASTAQSDPEGFYYYLYNWEIETAGFECASEKAKATIQIEVCTGINESEELSLIQLFPNPTVEKISIDYDMPVDEFKISNNLGETIFTTKDQLKEFNFTGFAPGVYLLTASYDNRQILKKIILE